MFNNTITAKQSSLDIPNVHHHSYRKQKCILDKPLESGYCENNTHGVLFNEVAGSASLNMVIIAKQTANSIIFV
jgi:hypothetical protein